MKVFFDLDDTLIKTGDIKEGLHEFFTNPEGEGGVTFSDPEIDDAYTAVYREGYDGPKAQLEHLSKIQDIDMEKAEKRLDEVLNHCVKPEIIFENVVNYLNQLRANGHEVHLITVGNPWYQQQKAKLSGIEDLVGIDKCIYTENSKHDEIGRRLDNKEEPFILVEDKDDTIRVIREGYPNAITVKAENGDLREIKELELSRELHSEHNEIAAA